MRKAILLAIGFFVLSAGLYLLREKLPSVGSDPDRYFHFALSRETVASGSFYLRTLPQVEGLGWNDYFVDKEFLFHQLTRLGFQLAGDQGVINIAFLCVLVSMLLFLLQAGSAIPPLAAIFVTLFTFAQPYLAVRMVLLRPHTLAILTFTILNIAVLRRRPYATAFGTMLFALSYHAVYLPLFCLGWLMLLSFFEGKEQAREWRKVAYAGAFGSVAGVLLNPYFPGNLIMAVIHSRIPGLLKNEFQNVGFGEELYPIKTDDFLRLFHGPFLVILAALLVVGYQFASTRGEDRAKRLPLLYLLGSCLFFLALTFQILRAAEYLMPLLGLLLVQLLERIRTRSFLVHAVAGALAFVQLGYLIYVFQTHSARFYQANDTRVQDSFAAIAAIPLEPKGVKVFNCDWDRAPYLLYARPDLRFIDILDPSFLYFHDPAAFWAREQFRRGLAADAHGLVRDAFHADYVLCAQSLMAAQLREDPGFQQIYPGSAAGPSPKLSLFRVRKEARPEFVQSYQISAMGGYKAEELNGILPKEGSEAPELQLGHSTYLNLTEEWLKKLNTLKVEENYCALVRPSKAEIRRLAGAEYLALGGGQGFRVWRNGKPLFHSRTGYSFLRAAQVVVPMGSPLKASEHLDILVCSRSGAPFFGITLSLWSQKSFAELCEWKQAGAKPALATSSSWPMAEARRNSCIGPFAGRDD